MDDGDNYPKNIDYYFLKQTNIYAAGPGLLRLHPKEGLVFLFNWPGHQKPRRNNFQRKSITELIKISDSQN